MTTAIVLIGCPGIQAVKWVYFNFITNNHQHIKKMLLLTYTTIQTQRHDCKNQQVNSKRVKKQSDREIATWWCPKLCLFRYLSSPPDKRRPLSPPDKRRSSRSYTGHNKIHGRSSSLSYSSYLTIHTFFCSSTSSTDALYNWLLRDHTAQHGSPAFHCK